MDSYQNDDEFIDDMEIYEDEEDDDILHSNRDLEANFFGFTLELGPSAAVLFEEENWATPERRERYLQRYKKYLETHRGDEELIERIEDELELMKDEESLQARFVAQRMERENRIRKYRPDKITYHPKPPNASPKVMSEIERRERIRGMLDRAKAYRNLPPHVGSVLLERRPPSPPLTRYYSPLIYGEANRPFGLEDHMRNIGLHSSSSSSSNSPIAPPPMVLSMPSSLVPSGKEEVDMGIFFGAVDDDIEMGEGNSKLGERDPMYGVYANEIARARPDNYTDELKYVRPEGIDANLREENRLRLKEDHSRLVLPVKDALYPHPSMLPPRALTYYRNYIPLYENRTVLDVKDIRLDEDCWGLYEPGVLLPPPMPNPFSYINAKFEEFMEVARKDLTLSGHIVLDIISNLFRLSQDINRQSANMKTFQNSKMAVDALVLYLKYFDEKLVEIGEPLIWKEARQPILTHQRVSSSSKKTELVELSASSPTNGDRLMEMYADLFMDIRKNHFSVAKLDYKKQYYNPNTDRFEGERIEKRLEDPNELPAKSIIYYTLLSKTTGLGFRPKVQRISLYDVLRVLYNNHYPDLAFYTDADFNRMSFEALGIFWNKHHEAISSRLIKHAEGVTLIDEYMIFVNEMNQDYHINLRDSKGRGDKKAYINYHSRMMDDIAYRERKLQEKDYDIEKNIASIRRQGAALLARAITSFGEVYMLNRIKSEVINRYLFVNLTESQFYAHVASIVKPTVDRLTQEWQREGFSLVNTLKMVTAEVGERRYFLKGQALHLKLPEKLEMSLHYFFHKAKRDYLIGLFTLKTMLDTNKENASIPPKILSDASPFFREGGEIILKGPRVETLVDMFLGQLEHIIVDINKGSQVDGVGKTKAIFFRETSLRLFDNNYSGFFIQNKKKEIFSDVENLRYFERIIASLRGMFMQLRQQHKRGSTRMITYTETLLRMNFAVVKNIIEEIIASIKASTPLRIIFFNLATHILAKSVNRNGLATIKETDAVITEFVTGKFFTFG